MATDLQVLVEKLSQTSKGHLEKAAQVCLSHTNFTIELEHILYSLNEDDQTDFHVILKYYGIPQAKVKKQLDEAIEKLKRGNERTPALSQHILTLLEAAWMASTLTLKEAEVRTGALLYALLNSDVLRGIIIESCPILLKIPRPSLDEDIFELVNNSPEESSVGAGGSEGRSSNAQKNRAEALSKYTIDLTAQARAGRIDPVEGRDTEIRQIIDILSRRRQNNPILTGEAGVGKTAVVEGFALKIAAGEVPPALQKIELRTLDLGLLEAGAGVKCEFENRLKSVIKEVNASPTPIILFIDEAHSLIGSGNKAGENDAANLLKPALARGELRTIAATTWSEYKKYFEKDAALARRFQVVKVEEPDEPTARIMLRSLIEKLESHHHVRILDEAVEASVSLSHRYITGRRLPDKAVSVLDTACARVSVAQSAIPEAIEALDKKIKALDIEKDILVREEKEHGKHGATLEDITTQVQSHEKEKSALEAQWQEEKTMVTAIRELQEQLNEESTSQDAEKMLRQQITDMKVKLAILQGKAEHPMVPLAVDRYTVAAVISNWTGIPTGKMMRDEVDTVLALREKMAERIIGQEYAIEAISKRIWTYRANLDDPNQPIGVFMLIGPSGIGKTETALTLADTLYGGEQNLITINMSEYQEAYSVSSLKGSPPGYVGYGTGGVLTEAVRRRPYSVILLDEIEKAHEDVIELFYQVFDKGTMEDSESVEVDFKNTIILLTTNVGSEQIIQAGTSYAKQPTPEQVLKIIRPEVKKSFKPAFLGRLSMIPYHPLSSEQIGEIVKLKLTKVQKRFLEAHKADLTYDQTVIDNITNRCKEVETGARTIDHILNHYILPEISTQVLKRIADEATFDWVHITLSKDGEFQYDFHDRKRKQA